ncbi:MAG TPA: polysaccharide deacetylase family protein [Bacteroidales bacterium]|nr:polysaccharide deacetylase family protein [Bacteroidales bacterium]
MRFYRPFFPARIFYPGGIFRFGSERKALCITFDDGPHPDSTGRLLEVLRRYDVPAVFFCNGKAAEKHPNIIAEIRAAGHVTGNHGYEHIDGFHSNKKAYLGNAEKAEPFTSPRIFRPPFGRLTPCQYRSLAKKYDLVFWDIMPYDFDKNISPGKSYRILRQNLRPGSVIVFHDTPSSHVHIYLDDFIRHALGLGYGFEIPPKLKQLT